jgi:hypothetical protein
MTYRALDAAYLNTYPPGQVEIAVYSRDSDTLIAWVTKHSGPSSSTDPTRYWTPVTNEVGAVVAGRDGLSFDWIPDQGDRTVHATIAFLGTTYVFLIEWWATDPSYAATVHTDFQQMVSSLQL